MSRSCHSATFSSAGMTAARTRRARPVRFSVSTGLRLCGIAERALLARREIIPRPRAPRCAAGGGSRWRDSRPMLAMTRQRREECRVPVARDDLGRNRFDRQAELGGDMRFDLRVDVGEGADRAGDGAGGDLGPRRHQPLAVAVEGGVVPGELQAEGGRLGMDAVAAADGGGVLVLQRAALQRRQQPVESASSRSAACVSWTAKQVSSTSDEVMP